MNNKNQTKLKIAYKMSYKKLWKVLIDKGMQKNLQKQCDINAASIAELGKDANVTTYLLIKICLGLNCSLADICETVRINIIE
ncbi:helix-turn-helix transcriptional regulator [Lactobacillus sp. ESL0225]|uniref:helix-turn-helix domain-containing protein n=1 Tax=Lactobacillus sp. ESL0225 TaxID=2069351 RepID=UPI000EFD8982|nr:helix-turn-helix transcriptional regulator [Lactobacillus sp. ESL0225]RMC51157.1 XRE family transcriptional regulator [Lactobacillus sp. ESL0225]